MEKRILHINGRNWPVRVIGTGDQLLIAFHGFGEDGSLFEQWGNMLGNIFTILAVDLPHHGEAEDWTWGEFRRADVVELIDFLLGQYPVSSYILLGHSFGARVLLACMEELKTEPEMMWALAPDGLATRRLGLFNRLPIRLRKWIGRKLKNNPEFWERLAGQLHRMGLLDAFSVRYIRHHISDAFRRRRLLGSWIALPHFPVDMDQLLKWAEKRKIHLVFGKADALINWERIREWLKKWPASNLHELDAGHDLINGQVARLIRSDTEDG